MRCCFVARVFAPNRSSWLSWNPTRIRYLTVLSLTVLSLRSMCAIYIERQDFYSLCWHDWLTFVFVSLSLSIIAHVAWAPVLGSSVLVIHSVPTPSSATAQPATRIWTPFLSCFLSVYLPLAVFVVVVFLCVFFSSFLNGLSFQLAFCLQLQIVKVESRPCVCLCVFLCVPCKRFLRNRSSHHVSNLAGWLPQTCGCTAC